MSFNPQSAFPKQTTFTPYVHANGHPQRAVNAPDFRPIGPARGVPAMQTAGRYNALSQQAAELARGAAGVGHGIAMTNARPSPLNEAYGRAMQKGRPSARVASPQPRQMGLPGKPMQEQIAAMAADIISSKNTPLAPTIPTRVATGPHRGGLLLG